MVQFEIFRVDWCDLVVAVFLIFKRNHETTRKTSKEIKKPKQRKNELQTDPVPTVVIN